MDFLSDDFVLTVDVGFSALHNGDADFLFESNMVAFPVVDSRQTTFYSNNGAALPTTPVKLVPRKGVTDVWFDSLNDILSGHKLTKITQETRPPTLAEVASLLGGVPPANVLEAVHNPSVVGRVD